MHAAIDRPGQYRRLDLLREQGLAPGVGRQARFALFRLPVAAGVDDHRFDLQIRVRHAQQIRHHPGLHQGEFRAARPYAKNPCRHTGVLKHRAANVTPRHAPAAAMLYYP